MDEESDETLDRIAAKYDYVEIQPAENKLYCIDDDEESYEEGLAYVQIYDKKVVEVAERLGKMVVATSDAHFVTKDEAIVRSVLQRQLLHQENMSKDNIIASREDVFDCLIVLGFTREDAFEIAEFVRKGKARSVDKKWQSYKRKMEDAGAPDWFIASCEKVRYLFPRAHSYIYALHAWWSAWFKLHYPKEFYEVYIEIKASNGLKQIVNQGKSVSEIYKTGYSDAILDGFCNPYVSEAAEKLAVVEEMFDKLCAK